MTPDDSNRCSDSTELPKLQPGETLLQTPYRSPLVVAKALQPYIENKVVCELGCAMGDLTLEMLKHARKVIAIDNDPQRVEICRQRGIQAISADVLDMPQLDEKIDVYYIWINFYLNRKVFDSIEEGTVIMAGELGLWAEKSRSSRGVEVKQLDGIKAEYPNSTMLEIEYDEGKGDRQSGTFVLLVVEKGSS